MRLKSVTVTNYRSFNGQQNKVEFPDLEKPISIIGHNNCGKTNLIQAILIATGQTEDWYRQKAPDFHNQNTEEKIKIVTKFNESFPILSPYPGDKSDKQCWGSQFTCGFVNGRADAHLNCTDEDNKIIIKQEKMKAQGLPANFTSQKKNLKLIYINFHDLDKHLSLGNDGLLAQLFREIKEDFYDPSNTITLKDNSVLPRSQVFESLTENLKKVLYTDMLKSFVKELGEEVTESLELNKDAVDFNFTFAAARELYNRAALMVSDAKGKVALPVSRLGSGLKAMIIVAMLKVLAERHGEEKIFILEEPETFLHELYEDYLYSVLCSLAKANQVIYTTHSKKFVDIFEPGSIIKVNNPAFLNSEIVQLQEPVAPPDETINDLNLKAIDDFAYFMRSLDPNIGLFMFSKKTLIVEGPHDVLAYRLAFKDANLAAKNICIVCAWGKDTSIYLSKLGKAFSIDTFVIHDWDLDDPNVDISTSRDAPGSPYAGLTSGERTHWTKNHKILEEFGQNIHWNKKNLEGVLGISNKGTIEVSNKLSGLSVEDIKAQFPGLISKALSEFMELEG